MKVDLLLHDDACHFEKYVERNHLESFSDIKLYVVDAFHAPNHKCSIQYWTGAVKERCAEVRTILPEVFNAWIRTLNFFFNGLRPHSQKFWVAERNVGFTATICGCATQYWPQQKMLLFAKPRASARAPRLRRSQLQQRWFRRSRLRLGCNFKSAPKQVKATFIRLQPSACSRCTAQQDNTCGLW